MRAVALRGPVGSVSLRNKRRFRPMFETLEDRAVPATLTVGSAPGDNYATISAAVNAASTGDTILVDPGTYNETVNVTKSLTIEGAQHGIDGQMHTGAESIVQGTNGQTAFVISANDVVIDGFTVQNATNANAFGAGIYITPGTSGTHIIDNVVQHNITGLFVTNSSVTDQTVVAHNVFRDNTQAGPGSGTDIYADQFTAGAGAQNILIQNNTFTNSTFVNNSWGIGISNTGATPFTNIQVLNNTFNNSGRGVYFFDTTNATVSGNTFTGMSHYAIAALGGVNGLTITSNAIQNGGIGILVEDDLGTPSNPAPNANIQVHQNNITGNRQGIVISKSGSSTVAYTGTLNAEGNWWGSVFGPGGKGPGLGDSVTAGVDFANWLTAPAPSAPGTPQTPQSIIQQIINDLIALEGKLTDNEDVRDVQQLVRQLNNSLKSSLWMDASDLSHKGRQLFDIDKNVVQELQHLLTEKEISSNVKSGLRGVIQNLVQADQQLATAAISAAVNANGSAHQIAQARNELAKGINDLNSGRFQSAVNHFENAWQDAVNSLTKQHDHDNDDGDDQDDNDQDDNDQGDNDGGDHHHGHGDEKQHHHANGHSR